MSVDRRRRAGIAAVFMAIAPVTLGAVAAAPSASATTTASTATTTTAPAIGHVWIIELENKGFDTTFGPNSEAPFLSTVLPYYGQLLTQYYGIGHVSLDNYVAEISGQAPNPQTQSDCQVYQDFSPPNAPLGADGQALGTGCVYPTTVDTLPNQLQRAGKTWRGYMQDMWRPCQHPVINGQDHTQTARANNQYANRHNPFVYFHSIIDNNASCQQHVVNLSALTGDLGSVSTTPNFSFITPDLCSDAHDATCADGGIGGLPAANAFLKKWVPAITHSPAYRQDGLLIIMFDESDGPQSDATACCGETPGPESPSPGISGPGGGRTGAVLLSNAIQAGSVNDTPFNHYSLLRSIEDIFGLAHLGKAAVPGLVSFSDDHDSVPVYK
jgi:phospholipase C